MSRSKMLAPVFALALAGVVGVAPGGCDDSSASISTAPLASPTYGKSSVRGRVTFAGTAPEPKLLETPNCHAGAKPHVDESLLVSSEGGLANAVVWLKDAPASTGRDREPVVIDQVDCQYTPHVVALQVGQPLRVESSDPVFHNTRYDPRDNAPENFGLAEAGDFKLVTFSKPEFIRLRCDVHGWMSAWVAVVQTPFAAVTDAEGNFAIDRVPAGTYRVGVWHELLGERETTLSVDENGTASSASNMLRLERLDNHHARCRHGTTPHAALRRSRRTR